MPFDFYGSHVFLTYSQVGDRSARALVDFLRGLSAPLDKLVVGAEQHQDGGRHFHVYAQFTSRFRTRNQRFFDFDGVHPNIKAVSGRKDSKSAKRVYEYVTKDNDVTLWPEDASFAFGSSDSGASRYAAVLSASSREEALEAIRNASARDWVIQHERILWYVDRQFPAFSASEFASPYADASWNPSACLVAWYNNNLRGPQPAGFRPKSLVLVGPSRLGKTAWARSLGEHVYVAGAFNAELFKRRYGYFVFDDVAPIADSLKRCWKQWFGGQRDFTVTGKYVKAFHVAGGVPSILCLNEDDFDEYFAEKCRSAWSRENLIVVNVLTPLYRTSWVSPSE